eukprot:GILJ01002401.1.p1 GENE.GILJ01002401.1~~GILJ01002401.1.p1  ORF type:complete len:441 (+),score=62.74 GILJ01002401.1:110-1432(+)
MSVEQIVAIVDPISSGAGLAAVFHRQGVKTVAVMNPGLPTCLSSSFRPSDFIQVIHYNGNLDETVGVLSTLSLCAVVAGSEPGVELADALSERLGLRTNGTRQSDARRNKYHMQEALRAAKVRAIGQFQSENVEELVAWAENYDNYPVVVKPVRSAGTDGVSLCYSSEDIRKAYDAIISKPNLLGEVNTWVLVQEYLRGTEYVVDTVSRDGQHHVAGYWCYDKRRINGSAFVYYGLTLLESQGETQDALKTYIFTVLDVLGIRNGPAHSEIMITPTGPCLVETGARMMGDKGPSMTSAAVGYGQLELTADVYLSGTFFAEVFGKPYVLKKYVHESFFVSQTQGLLKQSFPLAKFKSMPAYFSHAFLVEAGNVLEKTIDLMTSPGRIVWIHESKDVIRACEDALREMEENGMYELLQDGEEALTQAKVSPRQVEASVPMTA